MSFSKSTVTGSPWKKSLHVQPGPDFGLVAVAHRLDEQLAQRPILKGHSTQHVAHLPAQRLALLLQLLQQPQVDVALARLAGHQVPQVAHLRLADAVNAAEALLQAIGVPRQVVVDHQVGAALQVDALAGGVVGDEDAHLWVIVEGGDVGLAHVARHAAVDDHHRLVPADLLADLAGQVLERVARLGED
jgi:hypothetical protein